MCARAKRQEWLRPNVSAFLVLYISPRINHAGHRMCRSLALFSLSPRSSPPARHSLLASSTRYNSIPFARPQKNSLLSPSSVLLHVFSVKKASKQKQAAAPRRIRAPHAAAGYLSNQVPSSSPLSRGRRCSRLSHTLCVTVVSLTVTDCHFSPSSSGGPRG